MGNDLPRPDDDADVGEEPGPGVVDIAFVRGADGLAPIPEAVARAGLRHRFAVIQQTGVEGQADMVFDRDLWRALADFVGVGAGQVTVLPRFGDLKERALADTVQAMDLAAPTDWDPPWALLRRRDGRLDLAMVTDDWSGVGGPAPYHDSLTYSVYADRDLGEAILAWLDAWGSAHWRLGPVMATPRNARRQARIAPGFLRRLVWGVREALAPAGQPRRRS